MIGGTNGPIPTLNKRVARVLLVGGTLSIALLALGSMALLNSPSANVATALPFSQIPSALARGAPSAFFTLGILVMILTPVARVFVLVVGFAMARDKAFIMISCVVLALLLLSITMLD